MAPPDERRSRARPPARWGAAVPAALPRGCRPIATSGLGADVERGAMVEVDRGRIEEHGVASCGNGPAIRVLVKVREVVPVESERDARAVPAVELHSLVSLELLGRLVRSCRRGEVEL